MFKKQQLYQYAKPQIFTTTHDLSQDPIPTELNNVSNNTGRKNQSGEPIKTTNRNLLTQDQIDKRRIKRAVYEFQGIKMNHQQDDHQPQRKAAVKMNVFRQSARQQQREFHQQNHEYLRMFSVIASSALSMDKFRIKEHRDGSQSGQNKGQSKTSKSNQNYATVHLQLMTQVTSSLISYRFPIKEVYNTMPFKRESIEFQSRQLLDPKFEFFVFEKCGPTVEQVRNNLKNVLQEGLSSQFKATVMRAVNNLTYFQFLDLTNYRVFNSKSNQIQYPKQLIQISQQAQTFEITSDQQQFYTKNEISLQQMDTNERMVACQDFDLQQTAPSVYFELTSQYTLYKRYRQAQFKKLKIYNKDININTDIRNIISSQKIYLIQLVKQIDLYIELSAHQADMHIMKQVSKQLHRKCEEFLKVLCNYTESKILKHYNIDNYHEKIMMFIEKSIKYNKEVENVSKDLLSEFPILKIWYEIPAVLFGYSRETLHRKYYDLVRAMLKYQEKINDLELERRLSIKRPDVSYPE